MHNVPNYFTLLLLRVINARRLALDRGVFRARFTAPRLRDPRGEAGSLPPPPLPLPPSSLISLVDGRSAGFFHASFGYQLSAVHGAETARLLPAVFLVSPSPPAPSSPLPLSFSVSLSRRE